MTCTFLAIIAPLQTGITISSDGGMRVKIDIPESEMGAALELVTLRGKVLRVTVEEETKELDSERSIVAGRRSAKQRI